MRHGTGLPFWAGLLKRTSYNYAREVGDGLDSSVVTAPIQWIQRAMPEATLTVRRRKADGSHEELPGHKMLELIDRPNAYYGDLTLWAGTLLSYLFDGNGYWVKVRNGVGRPVELWYVPHWTMEPKPSRDGSVFLSHYTYSPGGGVPPIDLSPDDVVHFRHGIDPRNPRKGLSPLAGTLREIFMDLESSNFVASLLRNMGVPGVVISPKAGGTVAPEDVAATKAWFNQAFTGDRRGGALVMGAPTDVSPYGFNPQQMNMSESRDVAEERICACLGIPAAVVGFGAGLQTSKVGATMGELVKLAWRNGMLPVLRVLADELDRSLLPDFGEATGLKCHFDTSEVLALQDELDKAATRWNTMVQGGWVEIAEAREAMGLDVDDSHRIYLRPAMALETPAGGAPQPQPAPKEPEPKEQKARASRSAIRTGAAYLDTLRRQEGPLQKTLERRLKGFFGDLGKAAKDAALPLLEIQDLSPKSGKEEEQKSDDLLVAQILDQLGIEAHRTTFAKIYEAQYLETARKVSEAAELAGISGSLPDPVARAVAGAGGRRSGLVDLSAQTRKALFDAIAEGRAEGEGAPQLAARIADYVEGGPYKEVSTRARIIARTETKYAQNISTIERARAANVEQFIVFDGRLGPDRSDPDHIARNGSIVSAAEASQMAADEHPNGTLSFAPYFADEED
ncbi:Phage portal protein [Polymorphum gilvum SL003B-26A1]|uniref:Phage portal protein n=2 Tax=Polymorphum TaxID=991903 RepID=F2J5M4_POLGS|nr:Phage portal protein [Polymorphum gilvum SL003B-26A1]